MQCVEWKICGTYHVPNTGSGVKGSTGTGGVGDELLSTGVSTDQGSSVDSIETLGLHVGEQGVAIGSRVRQ